MAKKVSWMWGGKRYSGTLIRETKTHKFARTHNGKIKKIVKKKKKQNAMHIPVIQSFLVDDFYNRMLIDGGCLECQDLEKEVEKDLKVLMEG